MIYPDEHDSKKKLLICEKFMRKFQTEEDFIAQAKESNKITGDFLFLGGSETLMDRDFEGLTLNNCIMQGGDFCSSSFLRCRFENVVFKDSAFPSVTFTECEFNNSQFRNISINPSFTLTNCTVKSLSITTIHEPSETTS